jgi:tRNA(Ile)-lysidine synthase
MHSQSITETSLSAFEEKLLKKFTEIVFQENLVSQDKNATVAVAVSGGIDSMGLAIALKKSYNNIIALTVNHNLRKSSKSDTEFVRDTLKIFDIETIILNWDGQWKKNLEAEAREKRYNLMIEKCSSLGIKFLAVGHHKQDQVETFLLNLERGSGLNGLCAMPYLKKSGNVFIVRPMLSFDKREISSYLNNIVSCGKYNVSTLFTQDETNSDTGFKRNKVRSLIEQMSNNNYCFNSRISNTVSILQDVKQIVDAEILKQFQIVVKEGIDCFEIDRYAFINLNRYIQISILSKVFYIRNNKSFRLKSLENIIKVIRSGLITRVTIGECIISVKKRIIVIKQICNRKDSK